MFTSSDLSCDCSQNKSLSMNKKLAKSSASFAHVFFSKKIINSPLTFLSISQMVKNITCTMLFNEKKKIHGLQKNNEMFRWVGTFSTNPSDLNLLATSIW